MKKAFKLRAAVKKDWKILLDWRNDITTRKFSFNSSHISVQEHKEYIDNLISNSKKNLYIFEYNGIPVGTIKADQIKRGMTEISYTISPEHRGKKIGQIMINIYLLERIGTFICRVYDENISSIKLIEKLGFKLFETEKNINFYKLEKGSYGIIQQ